MTDETGLPGDLRVSWDEDNPEEVSRARESFEKYIAKGWIAFIEEPEGRKRVLRFRPDFEKIMLIPPLGGG